MRKAALLGVVLILLGVPSAVDAAVVFTNLGTVAPPATLGPFTVTAFSTVPQAAIADGTSVSVIPGSPITGSLSIVPNFEKRTIGLGWATWSHGYVGPVFAGIGQTAVSMSLPTGTSGVGAFRFYVEPNAFAVFNISATTNGGGTTGGSIAVTGDSGANGFGFYTTAGESLQTVLVTAEPAAGGFTIAEFGIAPLVPVPALPVLVLILLAVALGTFALFSLARRPRLA